MPCCHIPMPAKPVFPASLVPDAQHFSQYVGNGSPEIIAARTTVLTSALHLEMKLWKPTRFTYWENDAQRNSWAVMRVVMGKDTFSPREKCDIFDLICKLPSSCVPSGCVLEQYDGWLLKTVLHLRVLGLDPIRKPIPAGTSRHVSALASVGRAQKLLNIFLKYELCWQMAGQWLPSGFHPYAPLQIPNLPQFVCALHAPLDSIILKEIAGLPLGLWLRGRGLQKPSGNIQQSDGNFRPWSKLDCLRTYYGFQLMLRRIAMANWPKGCACSASHDKAIKACADWFNAKYPAKNIGKGQGQDWVQAACDLGKEVDVIRQTYPMQLSASPSANAMPLPTKSVGPQVVNKQCHQQSVPSKVVLGDSPIVYLKEGPKAYMKIVNACDGKNDGMICLHKKPHIWLKNNMASPRYLIGEIHAAGGNFTTEAGYANAPHGVPHCVGGTNYQGGVRFDSIVAAVRYLKRFFTIKACRGNPHFDQAWVDAC